MVKISETRQLHDHFEWFSKKVCLKKPPKSTNFFKLFATANLGNSGTATSEAGYMAMTAEKK